MSNLQIECGSQSVCMMNLCIAMTAVSAVLYPFSTAVFLLALWIGVLKLGGAKYQQVKQDIKSELYKLLVGEIE